MSNNDVPAANVGGHSTTSTGGDRVTAATAAVPTESAGDRVSVPELPPKLRVHALAKLLGTSSREVLAALTELGAEVRSPQSSITRDVALRVAEVLLPEPEEPGEEPGAVYEPAEPSAQEPAPQPVAPLSPVFAPPPAVFLPPTPAERAEPAERVVEPSRPESREEAEETAADTAVVAGEETDEGDAGGRRRRRRGRRGRGRGRGGQGDEFAADEAEGEAGEETADAEAEQPVEDVEAGEERAEPAEEEAEGEEAATRRRRRRRRRKGAADDEVTPREDDPVNTVVHVREARPEPTSSDDEVRAVKGSTRLEAKRQRRRDGREAGRRRVPVLSEAEFLARREAVDRKMVIRERGEMTQIAVLEDGVLVEHFVTSSGAGSMVGNVYLGRVQNVLPSMEAAFVDIGRGRNAVLYAGEVDWDAAGLEGKARRIEQALRTGDSVLVQVTKDPIGHKGARLTTQISLPGRFLVYVPGGGATGISRKLPDTERKRLKEILKRIVPDNAGVIIRTASEGISEDELARDVRRLQAQWEVIKERADQPNAAAPQLLYEEPDLLVKVIRDLFTEDFSGLVVQGGDAWDTIEAYVRHVAPDLVSRLRRHVANTDAFTEHRVDEQITKALDRKVWLPSGGYLVIDRTEAMTVIDVNTGKFTGSGGNLEETVTRNNLEAAEEIVRQLRLRDVGGIIVIDFIDMVLESNRDLVLRRLTECLGRDRTRHQVAEVTSLGLVQMTRKRVGTGLLEAFSSTCEHCRGRGLVVSTEPVHQHNGNAKNGAAEGGRRRGKGRGQEQAAQPEPATQPEPAVRPEEPVARVEAEPSAEPVVEVVAEEPKAQVVSAGGDGGRRQARRAATRRTEVDGRVEAEPAAEKPAAEKPAAVASVTRSEETVREAEPVVPVQSGTGQTTGAAPAAAAQPQERREAAPVGAVTTRTRRRRAAARPAGPPTSAIQEG
ncbi:translation initiation factor IF-2 N-terminal domain-containing protein [Streptoalloteichus hindustanus]|uniref:Ribonuclease E n=1 Tax=Streptoalloteichus hindustanus TaxID=2017 RepID=A0A1M5BND4_STRHI|nr:translation initiation factor IF-2 N-terminal domain-containing protein [Streptoalloteichus hindustanus]SHF44133.1 ribonuclease E [Streptoalloteichus hindustanus]